MIIAKEKKTVAIFDFDGTLTSKNTTLAFLHYTDPVRFYYLMPILLPILIFYMTKIISVDQLNNWLCYFFFKGKSKEHLQEKGRDFALKKLPSYVRAEAMLKLKEHQDNAHLCILATAAYDLYIKAWGDLHGFTEVLCTEIASDYQGKLTGKLQGASCYGPEKVNKIKQILPTVDTIIYAYGDSEGDKEMLNFATYSFYRRFDSNLAGHL
ncbi:HAD-IB family hydrolase [Legionella fallonii]|uniref:Putative HAD family hydrolase n=1 Tax=Legionella fallonii LLAP-10 TaxID=1212491 RepID=A0A098G7W8_9GAMM|nr:HAD-IB family hydrolase [Legionella fallonii]CEG58106.1 putative HAD family hydrolase [Legionella fallonii LLAP-10]